MLWIYGFFMAWGMFLSIPCPIHIWNESARGQQLACFPFTGLIIGGIWVLLLFLLNMIQCPHTISAVLLSSTPLLLSGFIHIDGFMDVCDAVMSRRDLETRQRILKDSHCGAFAVICVVLYLLCSWSLLLSRRLDIADMIPLAMIPVASRSCASLAVLTLRPMRTSQYTNIGRDRRASFIIVPSLAFIASVAASVLICGLHGIAPAAAGVGYWLFAAHAFRQLNGMNGDVSGFALTLGELVGLATLILVR